MSVDVCASSPVCVCVCVISVVGPEVLTVPFHLLECSGILCLCQRPPSRCHDRGEEKGTERERQGEVNGMRKLLPKLFDFFLFPAPYLAVNQTSYE